MLRQLAFDTAADQALDVLFVCDTAFKKQASGLMATLPFTVKVRTIPSGKLRRYAHFSWWQYIRHFSIVLQNAVDVIKTAAGFIVSIGVIMRFRPDVVFAKGGYVCLPMGLAARMLRVPLVIHDSDVLPGLTNKVLSRFATSIGTGMPLENYPYNPAVSHYVGVPISADIQPVAASQRQAFRQELGLPIDKKIIVAVGGGLGSVTINAAVIAAAKEVQLADNILFYNVTGTANIDTARQQSKGLTSYQAEPFVYRDMHKLLGAADIVVTRASATTLQELAGLRKAVIAVPARQLGDQQKNAEMFARYDAVVLLQDDQLAADLLATVKALLDDTVRRDQLATNLHAFARPQAARDMALLVSKAARQRKSDD